MTDQYGAGTGTVQRIETRGEKERELMEKVIEAVRNEMMIAYNFGPFTDGHKAMAHALIELDKFRGRK